MLQKNDECIVEISDLGTSGEGIGRIDGYVLFVKDTVIGDTVRVRIMKSKKNYGYAKLLEIITPSDNRVEAPCPAAKRCGGCQLQFMNYKEQLRFKTDKVENNIRRIGGIDTFETEEIIGMQDPFHYRNKAQFPMGMDKEGNIISGFYAGRTHSIIPVEHCMLGISPDGNDVNASIMKRIKLFMKQNNILPYDEKTGKGLVRHVLIRIGKATGQVMVCIVINGHKLPYAKKLVDDLKTVPGMTDISLNVNTTRNNVIMGKELISLFDPGYIEDSIGKIRFQISPRSFFQVNPEQTEKLYNKALEYAGLTGTETVWDLYCGIGSISLFLAQKAKKVFGVEIVPEAVEDARSNAQLNEINNVEFFEGAAEKVVPDYFQRHQGAPECSPDVIVVDPPRKGCDETLLETIVLMKPKRVVYVSCESASLARDLKWLSEHGYALQKVAPCDQFGQTVHVETVCLLSNTQNCPAQTVHV